MSFSSVECDYALVIKTINLGFEAAASHVLQGLAWQHIDELSGRLLMLQEVMIICTSREELLQLVKTVAPRLPCLSGARKLRYGIRVATPQGYTRVHAGTPEKMEECESILYTQ